MGTAPPLRDQQHQQFLDEHSQPERQITLEEGRSGLVELTRLTAKRQVDGFRSRELTRRAEYLGSRVARCEKNLMRARASGTCSNWTSSPFKGV